MRPGQGLNKQLNLLQIGKEPQSVNNQMSIMSKQSEAVTLLDAQVQTTNLNMNES